MPTPREAYTNSVQREGYSGVRHQAADFGAAGEILGRAAQGFGQQLGKVADDLGEIKERYDVAAVKQADAEDAIEIARIRATALTVKGMGAPAAVEESRVAIEKIRSTRLASMKSSRQQGLYSDIFNQRKAATETDFVTHSITQLDVAERGSALARAESSMTLAMDNYNTPEFDKNMDAALKEYAVGHRNESADEINLGQRKVASAIHRGVIETLITDPAKLDEAEERLIKFAKYISHDDERALRKQLNPLLDEQEGDTDFGMVLAGGAPPADGQADADAPTPAVPRQQGEPVKNVFSHVVGGATGGAIRSGYGRRGAPVAGASTFHGGVDIPAPPGSPIRPPMSGKVLGKPWFDDKGGYQIRVQHTNGMITGYAHMRSASVLKEGDTVDSTTTLGGVGSTGKSTGNHLHFTVRDAAGNKVDPEKISWKEAALAPPAKGGSRLPRYEGDRNELPELLDRVHAVATANNWSAKRYERAITRARQHAGVNEQVYNAQYEDLKDGVWGKIADLDGGDGLTSVAQLGGGFGELRGQDRLTVKNLIQTNIKRNAGGGEGEANSAYYAEVRLAAESDDPKIRGQFLGADFRADPSLTKAERLRLSLLQVDMRKAGDTTLATTHGKVNTFINKYAGAAQIATPKGTTSTDVERNNRRRAILFDTVNTELAAAQKDKGRTLNDDEIDGIVQRQTFNLVRVDAEGRKIAGGPKYLLDRTPKAAGTSDRLRDEDKDTGIGSMPQNTRNSIIRGLRSKGIAPTAENVLRVYLRGRS